MPIFLSRLIQPNYERDSAIRRRATVTHTLLLAFFVILTTAAIVRYFNGVMAFVTQLSATWALVLYILGRLGWHRIIIPALPVCVALIPVVTLVIYPNDFLLLETAMVALLAILISSLLLSWRANLAMIALALTISMVYVITQFSQSVIVDAGSLLLLSVMMLVTVVTLNFSFQSTGWDRRDVELESLQQIGFWGDSLPLSMLMVHRGRIRYANAAAEDMTGYQRNELLQLENWRQLFLIEFPLDEDTTLAEREICLITAEGERRWVCITATTAPYEGEIATLYMLTDITEQHSRGEQFRLLSSVVEESDIPVFIAELRETAGWPAIIFANTAFLKLTGYTRHTLLGRTPLIFQGPDSDQQRLSELNGALKSARPFTAELILYRQDGSDFTALTRMEPLNNIDGQRHFAFTLRDTSNMRELERETRELDFRQSMIANLMSDFAFMMQVDSRERLQLTWINGAYQRMFGLDDDDDDAGPASFPEWQAVVDPEDHPQVLGLLDDLLHGEAGSVEVRIIQQDGTRRWVRVNCRPVWDQSLGRVTQIYGSVQNIDDRVRAAESLRMHLVQQASVAEIGLLALNETSFETLAAHAMALLTEVLDVECTLVMLQEPDQSLRVIGEATSIYLQAAHTLADEAMRKGDAVVLNAKTGETRSGDAIAGAAVVIYGVRGPMGLLVALGDERFAYDDDEIYFMQSISNILSSYIEQTRVREAERVSREFADALREAAATVNSNLALDVVLRRILEFIATVVPNQDAANIYLLDDEKQFMHYAAGWGYDEDEEWTRTLSFEVASDPIFSRAVAERGPTMIADTEQEPGWMHLPQTDWIKSVLGAPIFVNEDCIGAITIVSRRRDVFTPTDGERVMAFTDKVGIAIQNARHAEELENRVNERTAELRAERERLTAILDASGDGIIYTVGRTVQFVNRSLLEMIGYEASDLIGGTGELLRPSVLTDAERAGEKQLAEVVIEGGTWRGEQRLIRRDGTEIPVALTVSPVGDINEQPRRTVTIVRDISADNALKEQRDRFIANAAHELRSPITNLNTRLYFIRRKPDDLDNQVDLLEKVILRMNRLASDLLDLSYFEHGRIELRHEIVILQQVVQDVVQVQRDEAGKKSIQLQAELLPEPMYILGDSYRLQQVFTNLIVNAVLYTPEDGLIQIRACRPPDNADEAWIEITDSGSGIPPEKIAHIFEPFYRAEAKHKGTGLGLSIAYEIVQRHKGRIEVESRPDEGSTFRVCLPLLKTD